MVLRSALRVTFAKERGDNLSRCYQGVICETPLQRLDRESCQFILSAPDGLFTILSFSSVCSGIRRQNVLLSNSDRFVFKYRRDYYLLTS